MAQLKVTYELTDGREAPQTGEMIFDTVECSDTEGMTVNVVFDAVTAEVDHVGSRPGKH